MLLNYLISYVFPWSLRCKKRSRSGETCSNRDQGHCVMFLAGKMCYFNLKWLSLNDSGL